MNTKKFAYINILATTFLLCLLCILLMISNKVFASENAIAITFYDRSYEKGQDFTLEDFLASQKMIEFKLSGDETEDAITLRNFRFQVKKLVASDERVHCLHLHFLPNSIYGGFVNVIDICASENARVYIPFKNDIWVSNGSSDAFKKLHPYKKLLPPTHCK